MVFGAYFGVWRLLGFIGRNCGGCLVLVTFGFCDSCRVDII